MSYASLLSQLYKVNTANPVKLGLENMNRIYSLLDYPMKSIPFVHVTGTNGKGSVSWKISKALTQSGIRTGLFVSPHISSFRERVQVNHVPMTEGDIEELLPFLFQVCEENSIPATFFELTTALAFLKYQKAKCESVVLEVGLGGRLDATNVVPNPTLSVITSVQLDHTSILGDTVEEIAIEKAGIIKPGADVLVGPGCPVELLRAKADEVGAPFHTIFDVLSPNEMRYPHFGSTSDRTIVDIDDLNHDIALAALKILSRKSSRNPDKTVSGKFISPWDRIPSELNGIQALSTGSLLSQPPCRFEILRRNYVISLNTAPTSTRKHTRASVDVILDIAHNADALNALANKVRSVYGVKVAIRIVLAMSADKDTKQCVAPLLDLVGGEPGSIICSQANSHRAMPYNELSRNVRELCARISGSDSLPHFQDSNVSHSPDIRVALETAIEQCLAEIAVKKPNEELHSFAISDGFSSEPAQAVVVVCGSAFIMAEVRAALGIIEPRDGEVLSAHISSASKESCRITDDQEYFKPDHSKR